MADRAHAQGPSREEGEERLGRYQLLGEIGRGGMAEVWLASTTGPVGVRKLVVIKRMRRGDEDDPELVTMFLDEARLALRLSHPNVVQTHEVAEVDGLPFIAMEVLEGQPLHRVLRRSEGARRLGPGLQMWVLCELLKALHYAHELLDYDGRPLRVVHRDVNPQNVFITHHGEVKLMDFGIAKARDSVAQTEVGMFKGKLAYMAPEQARGGAEVDRRVDVFAVGVMMAEALTGERMWKGRSDIEIATALGEGWVPPLPEGGAIPRALREICQRAIAVDPQERWPDARAMLEPLRGWLEGGGEASGAEALARWMEEHFGAEREQRAALVRRYVARSGMGSGGDGGVGRGGGARSEGGDPTDRGAGPREHAAAGLARDGLAPVGPGSVARRDDVVAGGLATSASGGTGTVAGGEDGARGARGRGRGGVRMGGDALGERRARAGGGAGVGPDGGGGGSRARGAGGDAGWRRLAVREHGGGGGAHGRHRGGRGAVVRPRVSAALCGAGAAGGDADHRARDDAAG